MVRGAARICCCQGRAGHSHSFDMGGALWSAGVVNALTRSKRGVAASQLLLLKRLQPGIASWRVGYGPC